MKSIIIHEWPTEGGICQTIVESIPEFVDDDEAYYELVKLTDVKLKLLNLRPTNISCADWVELVTERLK